MQQCSTMSLKFSCVHIFTIVTQWRKSIAKAQHFKGQSVCICKSQIIWNLTIQRIQIPPTWCAICLQFKRNDLFTICRPSTSLVFMSWKNLSSLGVSWFDEDLMIRGVIPLPTVCPYVLSFYSVCLTMNQILIVLHSTLAS